MRASSDNPELHLSSHHRLKHQMQDAGRLISQLSFSHSMSSRKTILNFIIMKPSSSKDILIHLNYEWTQWTVHYGDVDRLADTFGKHPLFVHIAPPRYKLQSKFSNYIWLHGLMKGYKRLKIPISSGCQAGPGSRHQVDVREMVEKWNAACSMIVILPLKFSVDQGINN